ncbi:MAG: hypothetical protein AAFX89_02800, partial [Pseudomonadota bacterium]
FQFYLKFLHAASHELFKPLSETLGGASAMARLGLSDTFIALVTKGRFERTRHSLRDDPTGKMRDFADIDVWACC